MITIAKRMAMFAKRTAMYVRKDCKKDSDGCKIGDGIH